MGQEEGGCIEIVDPGNTMPVEVAHKHMEQEVAAAVPAQV